MSRKRVFLVLLAGFLALCAEGVAYVIVTGYFDNDFGRRAERHLYSPLRGHQLNAEYQRRDDTENHLIHSAQGFRRDAPVALEKPAGTFRIFMLGGSTLYGIGSLGAGAYPEHRTLLNDETIPHFLEAGLNEIFSDDENVANVEVINAGVTAYHTFQNFLYIYETLYEYDPDLILLFDGHNDFYNVGVKNPITEYGYSSFNLVKNLNERRPLTSLYVGMRYLGDHSYFFRLIEKTAQTLSKTYEARPYNIGGDPGSLERDFERELAASAEVGFLRNYRLIERLAELHDFDFHVFLQPEVIFEDPALLSDHDRLIAGITREHYAEGREEIMVETRKRLPDLFAGHDIAFADIGDIAGPSTSDEALYIDYTHLTPRGSALVAERMLPMVEAMARDRLARHETAVSQAMPRSGE